MTSRENQLEQWDGSETPSESIPQTSQELHEHATFPSPRSKVVRVGQVVISFSCWRDSPHYCNSLTRLFAAVVVGCKLSGALGSKFGY